MLQFSFGIQSGVFVVSCRVNTTTDVPDDARCSAASERGCSETNDSQLRLARYVAAHLEFGCTNRPTRRDVARVSSSHAPKERQYT